MALRDKVNEASFLIRGACIHESRSTYTGTLSHAEPEKSLSLCL